jgi:two-component system, cell cycle response regulator
MAGLTIEIAADGTVRAAVDVLPIGLDTAELTILQRMFLLTANRSISYRLLDPEGGQGAMEALSLVDRDKPSAMELWHQRVAKGASATAFVMVSAGTGDSAAIRRPLLLPRVLGALDDCVKREAQRQVERLSPTTGVPQGEVTPVSPRAIRALIVDDSQPVREFMREALLRHRVTADAVSSGEEALFRSLETPYDLVFLDVVMNGIDGYEVCRQIKHRKIAGRPPTRVVMLTSRDRTFDRIRGALAGCDTYLTKPVDIGKLDTVITDCRHHAERLVA